MQRKLPGVGFAILLAGCSPAPIIDVTVRSPSDIVIGVSARDVDRLCVDSLVIRGLNGRVAWDVSRPSTVRDCVTQVSFPSAPRGFMIERSAQALAPGDYEVSVRAGIYHGIERFRID